MERENYRYILEPYKGASSRYTCPECGIKNEFVRYVDNTTNNQIADNVGKCNRDDKCGYHYTPKQYFKENGILPKIVYKPFQRKVQPLKISFIENEIVDKSLCCYENNNLVQYLISKYGFEKCQEIIKMYSIGTSKYWNGATVFWQQDIGHNVKAGKVMLYDKFGKRVKEPHNHITWAHTALKLKGFYLQQCFFGEHLLNEKEKPVAIVESEKTCLIASIYFPEFIWIATGGKKGLSDEKCKVLYKRNGLLIPDINGYEDWLDKQIKIPYLSQFNVSKIL